MEGANSEDTEKEILAEVEKEIEKLTEILSGRVGRDNRRRGFCRD